MRTITEEIMIRVISGVLIVLIVFIIFEMVSRMQKPKAKDESKPDMPGPTPEASQRPSEYVYNPFAINFG